MNNSETNQVLGIGKDKLTFCKYKHDYFLIH